MSFILNSKRTVTSFWMPTWWIGTYGHAELSDLKSRIMRMTHRIHYLSQQVVQLIYIKKCSLLLSTCSLRTLNIESFQTGHGHDKAWRDFKDHPMQSLCFTEKEIQCREFPRATHGEQPFWASGLTLVFSCHYVVSPRWELLMTIPLTWARAPVWGTRSPHTAMFSFFISQPQCHPMKF